MGVVAVAEATRGDASNAVKDLTLAQLANFDECCQLADRAYDHCEKALHVGTWDPPSFGCDQMTVQEADPILQKEVEEEFSKQFDDMVLGWLAETEEPSCCFLTDAMQTVLTWVLGCLPHLPVTVSSYESGIYEELRIEAQTEDVIHDCDIDEFVAMEGDIETQPVPVTRRPMHDVYFQKARCSDSLSHVLIRRSRVHTAMGRRKRRLAQPPM